MTPRPVALAVAVALTAASAGCITASHNAPGITQLAAPPRIESGDPAAFERATSPGQRTLMAIVGASFQACIGCEVAGTPETEGAGEVGGEVILEYHESKKNPYGGLDEGRASAWGLGLGFTAGFAYHDRAGTFHAMLNRRITVGAMVPAAVNAGIAIATDGMPGLQVSAHFLMLMVRARAVANHGGEILMGLELPIPLVFGWSR